MPLFGEVRDILLKTLFFLKFHLQKKSYRFHLGFFVVFVFFFNALPISLDFVGFRFLT